MDKNTLTEALIEAVKQRKEIEADLRTVVAALRKAGMPWSELALYLGVSKQGAQQRYGQQTPARDTSRDDQYTPEENAKADEAFAILSAVPNTDTKPETPSIFLDGTAPAKTPKQPKTPAKALPIYLQPGLVHAVTEDAAKFNADPSYPAQPGTGKGPHACPRCGNTNHHGSARGTIKFFPDCTPTRYDPPATGKRMAQYVEWSQEQ